mmetsp:Transcript_4809/g.15799  ORF Transcript_4809/g.15799 Transcript_4809/m.15799 type:complete len:364 (-) Transcript_4809:626-1717(-)
MPTAASKKRELERIQLPNGAAPVIRNKRTRNCAAVDPGSEQDPEDEEEEEVEEVEEESKDHTTSEEDEDMVGQNVPKSAIDVLHGARRIDGLLAMFAPKNKASVKEKAAHAELRKHLANARQGVEYLIQLNENQEREIAKLKKAKERIHQSFGQQQVSIDDQEKTINNLRKSNATLAAERKALETQIQIFRAGRQPSPAAAAPAAAAAAAHSQRPKGPAVPSDPEPAAASRAKRGSASMLIVPSAAVDIDGSSSDEEDQPPSGTKDARKRKTAVSSSLPALVEGRGAKIAFRNDEVILIRDGILKFGFGKWAQILAWGKGQIEGDVPPGNRRFLDKRTNVDIKDKARLVYKADYDGAVYGAAS